MLKLFEILGDCWLFLLGVVFIYFLSGNSDKLPPDINIMVGYFIGASLIVLGLARAIIVQRFSDKEGEIESKGPVCKTRISRSDLIKFGNLLKKR